MGWGRGFEECIEGRVGLRGAKIREAVAFLQA